MSFLTRWSCLALVAGAAFSAASAQGEARPTPLANQSPGACGKLVAPPCPLQHWMRTRMAAPLAVRDFPTLAASLDVLRTFNPKPDEWQGWDRIAREGAEAARRGDLKRAKGACTRCHTEYRRKYREQYAARKLP